jgi:hypothetical protein
METLQHVAEVPAKVETPSLPDGARLELLNNAYWLLIDVDGEYGDMLDRIESAIADLGDVPAG